MKKSIILLVSIFIVQQLAYGQDALTMHDLNFDRSSYNAAFIAAVPTPLNASITSSLGRGLQNTSKVNFLAYANIEKYGFGVGLKLNSKFYGLFKTNTAEFMYAKALKINEHHNMFVGINFGMHFSSLDMDQFTDYVNLEDPFIMNNELPQYRLTTGLGIGYTFKDKWKAGFSMPALVKNKNDFFPVYVMNVSYRDESLSALSITPQLLMYGSNVAPVTVEGNVTIDYKQYLWVKLGGRSTKTMVMGLGWHRKFVSVGYNYNMYFAEYAEVNPGIHNINVQFHFRPMKARQITTNDADFKKYHDAIQKKMDEAQICGDNEKREREKERENMEARLEALQAKSLAHEKDKKELEALIKKMEILVRQLENKPPPPAPPIYPDKEEKPKEELDNKNLENDKPIIDDNTIIYPDRPLYFAEYYVVIGAFKNNQNSIAFQDAMLAEHNIDSNITQSEDGKWYFVYTHSSDILEESKQALQQVKHLEKEALITGSPWIYIR